MSMRRARGTRRPPLSTLAISLTVAALALPLTAGCGGGDSSSTTTGASGASGVAGATGAGGSEPAGVKVEFAKPRGAKNALGAKLLVAGKLKGLANVLSRTFELPEPLTVRAVNGFGPGPFFNPKDNSITYPYGFSALVYQTLSQLHPEWSQYRLGKGIGAVNAFIFEHEFAHTLIEDFKLPVLGREEDAADDLAVLLLLPADGGQQFVLDSAQFWAALSDRQAVPEIVDYADVHSLDLQRAFSMLCELAGSSPENFVRVRALGALPPSRLAGCRAEYRQKVRSFESVLQPHVDQPLHLGL